MTNETSIPWDKLLANVTPSPAKPQLPAVTDDTGPKQLRGRPWQPGQSGNPKGRPRGARSRLTEKVMGAIKRDWVKHGDSVIERVREDYPAEYLRYVLSLLPRSVILETEEGPEADPADMTDEELIEEMNRVRRANMVRAALARPD